MRFPSQEKFRMFLRFLLLFATVSALACFITFAATHPSRHWNHVGPVAEVGLLASLGLSLGASAAAVGILGAGGPGATSALQVRYEWRMALAEANERLEREQAHSQSVSRALTQFARRMALAVDERTPSLRAHSERVAEYSRLIACELGLDAPTVERIQLAALLHDIGSIGVDDSILTRTTALTPQEFEVVKSHTVRGAAILRPIEYLSDIIPGVELHHESLDGNGYPHGLRGDEIPLIARVIAVAESFDAMTTDRPFQAAMAPEYVIEVMNRLAGQRYDPTAIAALTSLFQRGIIDPVAFADPQAKRMRAAS